MDRSRATVFGTVAEQYERFRPSYPAAAVADLVAWLGDDATVVEIGAGTGKATRLFAPHVGELVACEPDLAMAAVGRRECASLPNVRFVTGYFEKYDAADSSVDLVVAAQSWHWLDRDVAIPIVLRMLRPGARLALMWNRPLAERNPIAQNLREIYSRWAPELVATTLQIVANPDGLNDHAVALTRCGGFADVERRSYQWTATFTANSYAAMVATSSETVLLTEPARMQLLRAIDDAIIAVGGTITVEHVTDLIVATRNT